MEFFIGLVVVAIVIFCIFFNIACGVGAAVVGAGIVWFILLMLSGFIAECSYKKNYKELIKAKNKAFNFSTLVGVITFIALLFYFFKDYSF